MFFASDVVDLLVRGLVLSAMAMAWVILLVRILGLRSFSKMTNFDFVMTIAIGSLLAGAGQAREWTGFLQSLTGMVALFGVQWVAARARQASSTVDRVLENKPVMLMRDGRFLEEAMRETRVSRDDLVAKLREANVLDLAQVRAVVLETTGDISVLHGDALQVELLEGVRDQ